MPTLIMLEKIQSDFQAIQGFPVSSLAMQTIWKNPLSSIGQWEFSQEEIELLSLYVREGQAKKFVENCLIASQRGFSTKGIHYFKEYSKRYGIKDFMEFFSTLTTLLLKIHTAQFEEDDLSLQCKTCLSIAEEILNHACWGLYLLYQASGVRKDFQAKNVTPDDFTLMERIVILAARLYLSFLSKEKADIASLCESIHLFLSPIHFGFISTVASKGTRGVDGSFFRLRNGCNEIANALHALKIRDSVQSLSCDFFVAPFYSSLSCAALVYAACVEEKNKLPFSIHVYSPYEDHIRSGEWEGKKLRDILARISQTPPLIRPDIQVAGKKVLITAHSIGDGKALKGLSHFYKELGAQRVYLNCSEVPKEFSDSHSLPLKIQDLEIDLSPSFVSQGPAPLRQWQKFVAESKNDF